MLRNLTLAVAVAAFAPAVFAESVFAAPVVGELAPAFTGTDVNGKTVHLADYAGKTVVLEWTNDQCPYVRKHYGSGNMQKTQEAAAADGAVWLTIVSSAEGKQGYVTPDQAKALTADRGAKPSDVILDPSGAIGLTYGAQTTPHIFVIAGDGRLVYAGGIDDKATADPADIPSAKNLVIAALEDVKAGRPVQTPESEPYGCSIKY
ncbi:MAG: redoxin domain-containing protein [Alphaproteobacteria bacterium]|nr:redoxin domain-containing protein [Alphaproteobacteria bacterium]